MTSSTTAATWAVVAQVVTGSAVSLVGGLLLGSLLARVALGRVRPTWSWRGPGLTRFRLTLGLVVAVGALTGGVLLGGGWLPW